MKKSELDTIALKLQTMTDGVTKAVTKALSDPTKTQNPTPANDGFLKSIYTFFEGAGTKLMEGSVDTIKTIGESGSNLFEFYKASQGDSKAINNIQGMDLQTELDNLTTGFGKLFVAGMGVYSTFKIINSLYGEVQKLVVESFKQAIVDYSEFQSKSLAANIKPVELLSKSINSTGGELETFKKGLRSVQVDFERELLRFRESGVKNVDPATAKLIDRMLFTGQKVGELSKFLSTNAVAIGMNTQEAERLALKLSETAKSFELQQDTLLAAAGSIKELAGKIEGLSPGAGQIVTQLASEYAAKFGMQYGDSINSVLTTLLDPENYIDLQRMGLADISNKILAGKGTEADLKDAASKIVEYSNRFSSKTDDALSNFLTQQKFSALGLTSELVNAARQLSRAEIQNALPVGAEGKAQDQFEDFKTMKDVTNALRSEMYSFIANFSNILSDTKFASLGTSLIRGASDSFKKMIGGLIQTFAVPEEGLFGVSKERINGFVDLIKEAVAKPTDNGNFNGLNKAQINSIKNLNPEVTSPEKFQQAQLAKLDDINQTMKEANAMKRAEGLRRFNSAPYEMRTA